MKKAKLRLCRIVMLLMTIMILTGFVACGDSRELSDIAVVMGIAIDVAEKKDGEEKSPGKINVSVQVANPVPYSGSAGEGGAKEAHSDFSESGNSIFEIIRSITHTSSRRLYHSHNQIVVFSRELAEKEGVGDFVDYFLRDNEMRYSVLIAIADEKASDVFTAKTNYEHVPAKELAELIKNQASNSGSAICSLIDLARLGSTEGAVALVPLVKIKENDSENSKSEDSGGSEQESKSSGEKSGGNESKSKSFEVKGSAVFKGDKMIGTLSEAETRGALWGRDEVSLGIIKTKADNLNAEVEIFNCKTYTNAEISDEGKVKASIRCEIYANIAQFADKGEKIDEALAKKVAESCGKTIKEEIQKAYDKSVELKCDVFNLGEKIKAQNIKKWRQYSDSWQQLYSQMELTVDANVIIEDVGDLSDSVPWAKSS